MSESYEAAAPPRGGWRRATGSIRRGLGDAVRIRLVRNAALNVVSGGSAAVFTIVLPVLLASTLSPVALSVWTVVLQPAAYTALFTLGIQSVIARHVAMLGNTARSVAAEPLLGGAWRLMWIAAAVYVVVFICFAGLLARIYPAIPAELVADARWAVLLFALAQATTVPVSVISGYFFGIQDNLPVAVHAMLSRLLMAIGVIAVSSLHRLAVMSAAGGLLAVAANAALLAYYRRHRRRGSAEDVETIPPHSGASAWALMRECGPISIWAVVTFAIYGGSSTIASVVDMPDFAIYSVASGISLLLVGFHSAAFSTLVPHIADMLRGQGKAALAPVVHRASLLSAMMSAVLLLCASVLGPPMVRLLITKMPSGPLIACLMPLMLGNAIRLVGLPYANALVGLGAQRRVTGTAVLEAMVTLLAALVLGRWFGVEGVAWSIGVGGIASLAMHYFVNIRITRDLMALDRNRVMLVPLLIVCAAGAPILWIIGG
jgi:O-antigen/teichoic acid export membrane protein